MRKVTVKKPSFPNNGFQQFLKKEDKKVWQVLCGDEDHWRFGIYSPELASAEEVKELEKHTCPELFILISGSISLIVVENSIKKIIELKQNEPILINTWHNGFCPNGKFTGQALVIERDQFETTYEDINTLI